MSFYGRYSGVFGSGGGGGGGGTQPKANVAAIASAATSKAITFTAPFGSVPVVFAWLTSSAGSPDILSIIGVSVSTAGFTANLSTETPDATYSLNWIASEVNDS